MGLQRDVCTYSANKKKYFPTKRFRAWLLYFERKLCIACMRFQTIHFKTKKKHTHTYTAVIRRNNHENLTMYL